MIWPPMSLGSWSRWKDGAAVFQNIAVGVGVLVSGIWSACTFSKLQQTRRAQIEIERLEAADRAGAQIKIEARQGQPEGKEFPVFIDVSVANRGTRAVMLDLHKGRLALSLIQYDKTRAVKALRRYVTPYIIAMLPPQGPADSGRTVGASNLPLAPGQEELLSYLVYVDAPGIYLVDFSAPVEAARQSRADSLYRKQGVPKAILDAHIPYDTLAKYAASRYIEVR